MAKAGPVRAAAVALAPPCGGEPGRGLVGDLAEIDRGPLVTPAGKSEPLSADAAVDELLMHVGEHVIRGEIHTKTRAHAIYEQARNEGRRASLVDAERPNMFTSSVANIAPQSSVTIEIA